MHVATEVSSAWYPLLVDAALQTLLADYVSQSSGAGFGSAVIDPLTVLLVDGVMARRPMHVETAVRSATDMWFRPRAFTNGVSVTFNLVSQEVPLLMHLTALYFLRRA